MPSKSFPDNGYKNPDNDPRGPYRLTDLTSPLDRSLLKYGWHGRVPPEGRSWRISKEKADELERDGRIVFPPSGMPRLKRYLAEARQELRDLLTGIPDEHFAREIDFIQKVFPRLMNVFDYAEDETFYEYGRGRFRADVVLSGSIEAQPWVVIEAKSKSARNITDWVNQLRQYLDEFSCHKGFVISTPSQQSRLVDLIEAVENAETNKTKGKSLEDLARFLFDSVAALRCKYNNLQTRSSEIDHVIEYDSSKGYLPLFQELGRFSLIECKNWSKPVGVSTVRDFMGKLDKCKVRLGVIFSKNGVTGVDAGADALREIQSRFDRDGVFVLVFSLEDIWDIEDGDAFVAALDRKADSLRFDAQCW